MRRFFTNLLLVLASFQFENVEAVLGEYQENGSKGLLGSFYAKVEKQLLQKQNIFRDHFLPTIWCGIQDTAPVPLALSAIYPHLDNCCREHDNCPLIIERGECFEGLCNPSFLTPILSCDCEDKFRNCLQALPSAVSFPMFPLTWSERLLTDVTGVGYFGILPRILDSKCLKKAPPIVGCDHMDHDTKICMKYRTDPNAKATWQLFPIDHFNHNDWFRIGSYVGDLTDAGSVGNKQQRIFVP